MRKGGGVFWGLLFGITILPVFAWAEAGRHYANIRHHGKQTINIWHNSEKQPQNKHVLYQAKNDTMLKQFKRYRLFYGLGQAGHALPRLEKVF